MRHPGGHICRLSSITAFGHFGQIFIIWWGGAVSDVTIARFWCFGGDMTETAVIDLVGTVWFKVIVCFFRLSSLGDATHASGRQGVRDAEPNGRFGISTTLDPPVRSGSRDFRRLRP